MRKFTSLLIFLISCLALNAQTPDLVISEIMYNPPEAGQDVYEYVEVYNNGSSAVNLLGYSFTAGFEFTFTSGFNLNAGEYVLFATDSTAFANAFGVSAFQITNGSLSNSGELVQLSDENGNIVDEVDYDDTSGGWDSAADGFGPSLVLCDFNADNNDPASWDAASTGTGFISGGIEVLGNPGAASGCIDGPIVRIVNNEVEVAEDGVEVTISVAVSNAASETLTVDVAVLGSSTATLDSDYTLPASTTLTFDTGAAEDTLTYVIGLIDDTEVEPIETIDLTLANPSATLTIDAVFGAAEVLISDNDAVIPAIVINEIMYNPPGADDMYEYLELLNNDDVAVDVSGYYFSAGIEDTLPSLTLQPGEFLVLATDSMVYANEYGGLAYEWDNGGLGNGGELIELRDALGNIVDAVNYDDGGDWPTEPDAGTGAALVLCDPNSDNSLPGSWSAGVQPSDIFISGSEILGSPGAANDCTPPPVEDYVAYDIATVTTEDDMGVADSLGVRAQLTGVVYGVNLRPGGAQFTIIDAAGDGIALFSNNNDFGYTVTEGDEVTVQGVIGQFSGLTQLNLDTIIENSTDNALVAPTVVTELNEETESQLVMFEFLEVIDIVTAGGGLNVTMNDGAGGEVLIRVDFDTDITEDFVNMLPGGLDPDFVRITGIGGQFDSNAPFDEGYQLLPRSMDDFEIVVSTDEPAFAQQLRVFPNPTSDVLRVRAEVNLDQVNLTNHLGQVIRTWTPNQLQVTLDLSTLPAGIYYLEVVNDGERVSRKVIKE